VAQPHRCHFAALKKFALDNSDYTSHAHMQAAIRSYLNWRNGNRQISSEVGKLIECISNQKHHFERLANKTMKRETVQLETALATARLLYLHLIFRAGHAHATSKCPRIARGERVDHPGVAPNG